MSKSIPPEPSVLSKPEYNGACAKCAHRSTCKKPCFFVEQYLRHENRPVYEMNSGDVIVVRPNSKRLVQESKILDFADGKPAGTKQRAFSNFENFIAEFKGSKTPGQNISQPIAFLRGAKIETRQSAIFIDRFFHRLSYHDLAKKYGISAGGAQTLYKKATSRILKIVNADKRVKLVRKKKGEPIIDLPKDVRYFLLYSAFGLTVQEIAHLLECSHSLVTREIKKIRDQILAGEKNLVDFTPEDRAQAADRLSVMRHKRQAQGKKAYERRQAAR